MDAEALVPLALAGSERPNDPADDLDSMDAEALVRPVLAGE
ncbi:hypothetical protein ACFYTQ_07235 [Nocardia sp. NPDC004068]